MFDIVGVKGPPGSLSRWMATPWQRMRIPEKTELSMERKLAKKKKTQVKIGSHISEKTALQKLSWFLMSLINY